MLVYKIHNKRTNLGERYRLLKLILFSDSQLIIIFKKMKKGIFLLSLGIFFALYTNAQETKESFKPGGKIFGKVFFNYNYNLTKEVDKNSSFEVKRSYFGAKYNFSKALSTKITFDVGSNAAGSAYTAFLKTAQLDWRLNSILKLTTGLMGLKQYNNQEHLWGYRYIYKSFIDEYGFGTCADLGANIEIKPIDMIKVNLFVLNGDGYKAVQDNYGKYRVGGNLILTPINGLEMKTYFDMMPSKVINAEGNVVDTATIGNIDLFAGYKAKKFRLGAEYNMLTGGTNYSHPATEHNLYGISVYGTYMLNEKFEFFGRFDQLRSNTLIKTTDAWNISKDGNAVIGGVQYAPVKGIKMSLNYQIWNYSDTNINTMSKIYISLEYKF